ncbi:MAG: carboxylating nicotinate-nucleotide diphosphorylase [Rhodothermales bacterium]
MNLPPYLSIEEIDDLIGRALAEDVGSGDITTRATVPPGTRATGQFVAKEPGTLAGLAVAERVFTHLSPDIHIVWETPTGQPVADGDTLPGTPFGRIEGPAIPILEGERLVLNILQRMSGTATATGRFVDRIAGTGAALLDTRKTVPGLRKLDKWAVLLGGGQNHRVGLFDMFLIKENHILAAGGIGPALDRAQAARQAVANASAGAMSAPAIEIEVTSLDELTEVLEHGGADRIMLDNFATRTPDGVDTARLREAIAWMDRYAERHGGPRPETEASGNVDLDTVRPIAETGVDFISVGALTHSVRALDISLLLRTRTASTES